jgi:hypothetical protein
MSWELGENVIKYSELKTPNSELIMEGEQDESNGIG